MNGVPKNPMLRDGTAIEADQCLPVVHRDDTLQQQARRVPGPRATLGTPAASAAKGTTMLNTTMMCASVLLLACTIYFGRPTAEPAPVPQPAARQQAAPAAHAVPSVPVEGYDRNKDGIRRSGGRLML